MGLPQLKKFTLELMKRVSRRGFSGQEVILYILSFNIYQMRGKILGLEFILLTY